MANLRPLRIRREPVLGGALTDHSRPNLLISPRPRRGKSTPALMGSHYAGGGKKGHPRLLHQTVSDLELNRIILTSPLNPYAHVSADFLEPDPHLAGIVHGFQLNLAWELRFRASANQVEAHRLIIDQAGVELRRIHLGSSEAT
jgi:hypothetical protein